MSKYKPLIITVVFSTIGLLLATLFSFLRFIFEGGEINDVFSRLEGTAFLAVLSVILAVVASEINFHIKSNILSSILFGILSPAIFICFLWLSSLFFNGVINSMPAEFYLFMYAFLGGLGGAIFFGTLRKNT
ncbi:hypothetical protein [Pseudoalteromonas rubra]|uniref:hypothetical protein n=1 Tax=Pseudoalteromonas rubra TaxID=43658 RepID=UPI00026CA279|nr:hypothetical protein [Pseudoalteromonas rubra]